MLRARWLGTVPYREAIELQRALFARSPENHLILLEHPPVYTMGARAKEEHLLFDRATADAEVVEVDRGGDVTYHGPGQLVGYPILSYSFRPGAVAAYVHSVEQVVIDALGDMGVEGLGRRDRYPGVWLGTAGGTGRPRKVCAVGVRMSRGRTMHGFAVNVATDLARFAAIVPCGITDAGVTSLAAEGYSTAVTDLADALAERAAKEWGDGVLEYQRAAAERAGANRARRLSAGVIPITARKPDWLRAKAEMGPAYLRLRSTMRSLDLVTVCEEAGCPNIFECWSEGTATFMINGDRCTRACGFCRVDTRRPLPPDPAEPRRVADAVLRMGLSHAVVTAVARDDLPDGGASGFVSTIEAIRMHNPGCAVEVLIPDCKGHPDSLDAIFSARPDIVNHNLETVLRLQRTVRPSAGYARSLAVLARAKSAGLTTKSGVMVGLGESRDEVLGALHDLAGVGVDVLTIGQYLRPSAGHLPVSRYWSPEEIASLGDEARSMGFLHVEASPLTRSSYHASHAPVRATGGAFSGQGETAVPQSAGTA